VVTDYGGSGCNEYHHQHLNAMRSVIFLLFIVVPWVNPFSVGPTPVVINFIISAMCLSGFVICTFALTDQTETQSAPHEIPAGWLCAAGLSALAGLVQYAGAEQFFSPWIAHSQLGEAYGNLRQRNQFATLVNLGLATVLWWRLEMRTTLVSGALWGMAILLTVGNAASFSRTGLIEIVLLVSLAWLWRPKNVVWHRSVMLRMVVSCMVMYVISTFALPIMMGLIQNSGGIFGRFRESTVACQSRLVLWSNVLHLISQKPWAGWGWGELAYAHFVNLYPGDRFCDILDNAHNLPLHLAVTLGIPVAAIISALCIWLIAREKPWKEQDPMRQLAWTILALIGLHSLLEYPLWYGPFQMAVLLCTYMLWRISPSWRNASDQGISIRVISPMVAKAFGLMAILVMAGCACAVWDYWRVSQVYTVPAQRAPAYRDDTLRKIQDSWLFQNQVQFAELNVTPLTKDNAEHINALAKEVLHFSPEPSVVKKLIESATLLGHDQEAAFYLQRFKAAFPDSKI
jgi:O-antigen ligase